MDINALPKSWQPHLSEEFTKPYMKKLQSFLCSEYQNGESVYPESANVLYSLACTPLEKVKVVILGQDPYHGLHQAHGLSFSVPEDQNIPPSLKNIYKELAQDLGIQSPLSGNLTHWAKQGVLLLNATLTVRASSAGSHQNQGWEIFTDKIIEVVNQYHSDIVFILWGNFAQKKGKSIDPVRHKILMAAHPSPLSAYRGFFGSKPFSTVNKYLSARNIDPIHWTDIK
jgi:uracil-DNA glycosylase